jgi:hypothetical protein
MPAARSHKGCANLGLTLPAAYINLHNALIRELNRFSKPRPARIIAKERSMSKSKDTQKEGKKKPALSPKDKKKAKQEKKKEKGRSE